MDLAKHIERICKIEDITIVIYSGAGRGYRRKRLIKIRPVRGEVSYAIALHEIGHVLGPRQSETRLYQEVGAWEWAIKNAIRWTPPMSRTMQRCLQAYKDKAERSPKWRGPNADHPIHAMLRS